MNKLFILIFIILLVIYTNVYWYFKEEPYMIVPYELHSKIENVNIFDLINKKTPFYQVNSSLFKYEWQNKDAPDTLDYRFNPYVSLFNLINYNSLSEKIYNFFDLSSIFNNEIKLNNDIIYFKKVNKIIQSPVIQTNNYINVFYALKGNVVLKIYSGFNLKDKRQIDYFNNIFYIDTSNFDYNNKVISKIKLVKNTFLFLPVNTIFSFETSIESKDDCILLSGYYTSTLNKVVNTMKFINEHILKF